MIICVKCENKRKQKAEPRKKEQKKILEKSGLYRERQSADPLTQALFEDNAIQDSCRKDNMGSIKPRDESLAWRESRSRSPSGSAGTAPRRRAFSPLMLFRDLFFHFAFSGLLLTNRAYFESRLKEFCDTFGTSDLFSLPLRACACLRRPSAQREGVRAAPPHGRLCRRTCSRQAHA